MAARKEKLVRLTIKLKPSIDHKNRKRWTACATTSLDFSNVRAKPACRTGVTQEAALSNAVRSLTIHKNQRGFKGRRK